MPDGVWAWSAAQAKLRRGSYGTIPHRNCQSMRTSCTVHACMQVRSRRARTVLTMLALADITSIRVGEQERGGDRIYIIRHLPHYESRENELSRRNNSRDWLDSTLPNLPYPSAPRTPTTTLQTRLAAISALRASRTFQATRSPQSQTGGHVR